MNIPVYRCCGDCEHFKPSKISKMGMGHCTIGGEGTRSWLTEGTNHKTGRYVVRTHYQRPLWPRSRRYCSDFKAIPI